MPSGPSRVKTGGRSRRGVVRWKILQKILKEKKRRAITVEAKSRVGRAKAPRNTPVALSNVRWKHLEQFDLQGRNLGEIDEDAFEAIAKVVYGILSGLVKPNRPFSHVSRTLKRLRKEEIQAAWKVKVVELGTRTRIRLAIATACRKSEAWARDAMGILIDFIKAPDEVLCHPELTLAASGKSARTESEAVGALGGALRWDQPEVGFTKDVLTNPGRIVKDEKTLEVTGSIDFMISSFPSAIKPQVDAMLEHATTLDRAVAAAHLSWPLPVQVNLLPIEAKRNSEDEDIEANLPQVLSQSYISMRKAGRKSMGWVLSNGDTWIFGVSNITLGAYENSCDTWSYEYFQLPKVIGSLKERNRPTDGELDAIMERARYVVKVLMFWCYADPNHLWKALKALDSFRGLP